MGAHQGEDEMTHRFFAPAIVFTLCAGTATAGGIERTSQLVGIVFESGRYAELSFGAVDPTISGNAVGGLGGFASGDMAPSYLQFGAAYHQELNENLSLSVIFDQPFGADVRYPTGTNYFGQGATAELRSNALTGILRYRTDTNFSVYGGLRYQTLEAKASVPFVSNYTADGGRDGGVGWLVGAGYEIPDIALRVALTYNSSIEHDLSTVEGSDALGADRSSITTVDTPQSVNLDFQTGIAANTLLFAGVRWVDWSEFDITPVDYQTITSGGSLVSYADDTISYTLGIGYRINETWSVSGRVIYEEATGGFASNLGPRDGYLGGALGVQYTQGNMEVSAGLSYVDIGDAQTRLPTVAPASNFTGNSAIGGGIRVGYRF
jgi:long-subunit fatty acid transport protein